MSPPWVSTRSRLCLLRTCSQGTCCVGRRFRWKISTSTAPSAVCATTSEAGWRSYAVLAQGRTAKPQRSWGSHWALWQPHARALYRSEAIDAAFSLLGSRRSRTRRAARGVFQLRWIQAWRRARTGTSTPCAGSWSQGHSTQPQNSTVSAVQACTGPPVRGTSRRAGRWSSTARPRASRTRSPGGVPCTGARGTGTWRWCAGWSRSTSSP
mmetsp:Transcript_77777/g.240115  ORF Transcript_77777/g.240115 Transcript_77777/m.240115 type:complete len:210 (+) Transcript_77777:80-709(+)